MARYKTKILHKTLKIANLCNIGHYKDAKILHKMLKLPNICKAVVQIHWHEGKCYREIRSQNMKDTDKKVSSIRLAATEILNGHIEEAGGIIASEYAFEPIKPESRSYTDAQKMRQFCRDGFIDRYSGSRLINPGMLRTLSYYMPEEFPFQKNWKMSECHMAYWEFVPTIDHIVPVALGGADDESNWATTSMMHNHIKSNWTLEQLNWKLYNPGNLEDWDGLTSLFIKIAEKDSKVLEDGYIRNWYKLSLGM